jgi:hypothetical protein
MTDMVQLTKSARLVIAPDPLPSNPRTTGDRVTGVYTPPYAALWGFNVEGPPALYDYPGRIVEAFDLYSQELGIERAAEILARWSMIHHGLVLRRINNSFWFCDRNMFEHLIGGPFTAEMQAEVIEQEATEYRMYEEGEANVVTFQRLAKFKRVTPKLNNAQDDLLEVWENVEFIGNVYFDPIYDAVDVAYEYFYGSMTRREQAVLSAIIDERRAERALQAERQS